MDKGLRDIAARVVSSADSGGKACRPMKPRSLSAAGIEIEEEKLG